MRACMCVCTTDVFNFLSDYQYSDCCLCQWLCAASHSTRMIITGYLGRTFMIVRCALDIWIRSWSEFYSFLYWLVLPSSDTQKNYSLVHMVSGKMQAFTIQTHSLPTHAHSSSVWYLTGTPMHPYTQKATYTIYLSRNNLLTVCKQMIINEWIFQHSFKVWSFNGEHYLFDILYEYIIM